jgi:phosphoglycolate phosphatase-like HAD superfamily hydrolase
MLKTLIIFDIDGTLLHSNRVDSQCFAQAFESVFKKPFPTIDWRKYPHVTDTTIFNTVIQQHFGRPATEEDIHNQQDCFVELLSENRRVDPVRFAEVPNAKNTIEKLIGDERFVVGIATGGWQRPATLKLKHIDIPIRALQLSFADGKATREEIINESIEKASYIYPKINRIVYIGDAVWDVKATRNMQLNFLGIRINGDHEVLIREGASHVIENYKDYEHFLHLVEIAQIPSEV